MNIGFFYVPYHPLTSGMSVHGHQLVAGLRARGHRILSCLGPGNPGCIDFPRTKAGALRLALQSDVLYIRVSKQSVLERATLLKLLRPFSLPVVWEVNAPVEELAASRPDTPQREHLLHRETRRRKRFARLVAAGIGVSEVLRRYIHDDLGIRNAVCIPNGSDPAHFDPAACRATALEHLRGTYKVFWTGNSRTPWQGIDQVIQAAALMQDSDPDVLFVIMTGEGLWTFPVTKNMLVLRQVPYPDFPHYLAAADVCLCLYQPYDWTRYGFYNSSLKLFDYMAAGKPVIASRMGQLASVIQTDRNGILVEHDPQEIVRHIRALKNDPRKAATLGQAARQDIIDHYSWKHTVDATEQLLLEVCRV
jgi:glycosyltransferase involved in cell wall biosynthesis